MDNSVPVFFFMIFLIIGILFGFNAGTYESKEAIKECEQTLPRDVHCKIIAVQVDKN